MFFFFFFWKGGGGGGGLTLFQRETIFVTSCLLQLMSKPFQNGVSSQWKEFAP